MYVLHDFPSVGKTVMLHTSANTKAAGKNATTYQTAKESNELDQKQKKPQRLAYSINDVGNEFILVELHQM